MSGNLLRSDMIDVKEPENRAHCSWLTAEDVNSQESVFHRVHQTIELFPEMKGNFGFCRQRNGSALIPRM